MLKNDLDTRLHPIKYSLLFGCAFFTLLSAFVSCSDSPGVKYPEGEQLASKYCGSCHSVPGPEALSSDLWMQILPRMGARLGRNFTQQEAGHYQALSVLGMNVSEPAITNEDWEMLRAYFLANSPETLPYSATEISPEPLKLFKSHLISISNQKPAASLVRFDSTGFWYGDALQNKIYFHDLKTSASSEFTVSGAPADILLNEHSFSVLTMGNIFPNDDQNGQLLTFNENSDPSVTLNSLSRPVRVIQEDLNGDDQPDLLICGFGHLKGSLDWYEKTDEGYEKHTLRSEPGAIKAVVDDLNNDGSKDILVLMAQGQEGFYVYMGDGQGKFRERSVYSFPSYYGSSYFELKDMNNDGLLDIIYSNGDTGDYDYPALKPYHAVRILLQQDSLNFSEAFSFPMHGPFNAMAEDYDQDGDIDIAVTSYFPDFENTPEEGFLILENQGGMEFVAKSLPESSWGNWLSADRADFDHDGDIDIILGNGPVIRSKVNPAVGRLWQEHMNSVILLENLSN